MDSLTSYAVRDEAGLVDVDATVEKFRGDLLQHIALRETEETAIGEAVAGVFDDNKGVRLNMPALITFTLVRLGASAANHKVLSERIAEHVRARSQGEKGADGKVANPDSLYVVQRGRNGGCWRRADRPTEAE